MVKILMMSVKLATLSLLKIKGFLNKSYEVIISVYLSMTSPAKSCHVNQIIL